MKRFIPLFVILFAQSVAFAQDSCGNDLSLSQKLVSKIQYKCSKRMKEAIYYKEKNKQVAMETLNPLCNENSEITPDCIIFGKDASVSNNVISQVCPKAKEENISCLLVAVSEKKTDPEMISSCGKK